MVAFSDAYSTGEVTGRSNVAPRQEWQVNVGMAERIAAAMAGGAIAYAAVGRSTITRTVLGAISGSLIYRSISGHCPVYERLGINTAGKRRPELRR